MTKRESLQKLVQEGDVTYYYHGQADRGEGGKVPLEDLVETITRLHETFAAEGWAYAAFANLHKDGEVGDHTLESLEISAEMATALFRMYASLLFSLEDWQRDIFVQAGVIAATSVVDTAEVSEDN